MTAHYLDHFEQRIRNNFVIDGMEAAAARIVGR
jgi:hypothetical protein